MQAQLLDIATEFKNKYCENDSLVVAKNENTRIFTQTPCNEAWMLTLKEDPDRCCIICFDVNKLVIEIEPD